MRRAEGLDDHANLDALLPSTQPIGIAKASRSVWAYPAGAVEHQRDLRDRKGSTAAKRVGELRPVPAPAVRAGAAAQADARHLAIQGIARP